VRVFWLGFESLCIRSVFVGEKDLDTHPGGPAIQGCTVYVHLQGTMHTSLSPLKLAGFTALHVAAFHGLDTVVSQLLAKKPALVDSRVASSSSSSSGSTALHMAAGQGKGRDKVVEVLLAAKSSVEATDFDGRTALHYAARAKLGSCRVVELLLAVAASPEALLDARDEEGHTALLSAIKARHTVKVNNTVKA